MTVFQLLRKKYPEKEYALLEEVSDKAGFARSRSADFIIMNLWQSRGLSLSGIELKSSRADWLSEKRNPKKAENIFQYCDYFWLLTTDQSITTLEEIPENWGWMCIQKTRIIIKKPAPKLTPKPVPRTFLAPLLKRACSKTNYIRRDEVQDEITASYEKGKAQSLLAYNRLSDDYTKLKATIIEYQKATGINLLRTGWLITATDIGNAVKFVQEGGTEKVKKDLKNLSITAENILKKINHELTAVAD